MQDPNFPLPNEITTSPLQYGQRIKNRREEMGYTQEQLSERMPFSKLSYVAISNIENGQNKTINRKHIRSFADALDCTTDYLLCLVDHPNEIVTYSDSQHPGMTFTSDKPLTSPITYSPDIVADIVQVASKLYFKDQELLFLIFNLINYDNKKHYEELKKILEPLVSMSNVLHIDDTQKLISSKTYESDDLEDTNIFLNRMLRKLHQGKVGNDEPSD